MLPKIAAFEFRYQLRNPILWGAMILLFLFTFSFAVTESLRIGVGGNVQKNSGFALGLVSGLFSIFYMFVTAAFVANVVVRDDETRFGSIVHSTRITKSEYLFGRFAGGYLGAALGFLAVPLGVGLGTMMPWLDPELLGPSRVRPYAAAYLLFALPNIFISGAIFFALATATRSMIATYVGVVVFLLLYAAVTISLSTQPQLAQLRALLDPFGVEATIQATRYWTPLEQNEKALELRGYLLLNRLIWIGVAFAFLGLAYISYRYPEKGLSKRRLRKQKRAQAAPAIARASIALTRPLPSPSHDAAAYAQMWGRTKFELSAVFKGPAFFILMVFGVFQCVGALWNVQVIFGTATYPVTRHLIEMLELSFSTVPTIMAVFYAGELVWRDEERRMHEIIDATPLPNWAYAVPKTAAVCMVLFAAILASVLAAIAVQVLKGHPHFEPSKYLLWYIAPRAFDLALVAVLAVFVQVVSPHKYVGWGIMLLYVVVTMVAPSVGLDHNLMLYGSVPSVPLSDMNGAGTFWRQAWWFRIYWGALAALLLVAAHLLWRRGTEARLKPRLARAAVRLGAGPGTIAATAAILFVASGAWIFYNTNLLNEYRTAADEEEAAAEIERRYLRYERLAQPTITDVKLAVALYPGEKRAETQGTYVLTNLSGAAVDSVHLRRLDPSTEFASITFPGARLRLDDQEFGYRIYTLDRPMAPGERRTLTFQSRRGQRGFPNEGGDTALVDNGTFLSSFSVAPVIGMSRDGLLQDRAARRRHRLSPVLGLTPLEDRSATMRTRGGLGWARADITVSTIAGQTPLAPGKKVSDVTRSGRRIGRFVSESPILPGFSIQSARYAERHRRHRGVDLSVYYHAGHPWNVERMLESMQASLDYYQSSFGPYQFDQARIIEFPGYENTARAFANTIPYSESVGFIADNRDPTKLDYVALITAHEMAHQYWGHQMVGADMEGATLLSETLAEYSALMVVRKLYGESAMRRFLSFELDGYLRDRGGELAEEKPLVRVGNQRYVHYHKGAMALYLLQDRLGEAVVNRAIRALLQRYKFGGPPFPRSTELVEEFRKAGKTAADRELVADLFERITLYDLKVSDAKATRRADGRWNVAVVVEAAKIYADGRGKETQAALVEPINVGLLMTRSSDPQFAQKDVLHMQRMPIRSGRQVLHFVTARKPAYAAVDPYAVYIDRNVEDNLSPVT
jgi:aminopeptidase N